MKCAKLLCVSTLALALVGCSSNTTSSTATAEATAASTAEATVVTSGKYEVTNNTGAVVTELYFYDATSSEKGDNLLSENLEDGSSTTIEINVDEDKADGYQMMVEYVTESGDSVTVFESLHLEEAPMYLKSAADIESGATPFSKPE